MSFLGQAFHSWCKTLLWSFLVPQALRLALSEIVAAQIMSPRVTTMSRAPSIPLGTWSMSEKTLWF